MKTLFVVGAGASADFGLPVGAKLQRQIVKLLQPSSSNGDLGRDIDFIVDDLERRGLLYRDLHKTLTWMSSSLPLARSIDSFLEAQSNAGDAIAFLGKYAIVTLISQKETETPLFSGSKTKPPNFEVISNSWLGQLWPLINKGGAARIDEKGLDNYAFLTFNYDRCIEQFLFHAFSQYYRMQPAEAAEFVENVWIHHVYGSLGNPFPEVGGLPFGYRQLTHGRIEAAENIKTYSEQLLDSEISNIADMFKWSERIIFLGFSFAPMNTDLIKNAVGSANQIKPVFGTAFEMSLADRDLAERWCNSVFKRGASKVTLDNVTGTQFFRDHQLLFR